MANCRTEKGSLSAMKQAADVVKQARCLYIHLCFGRGADSKDALCDSREITSRKSADWFCNV
jgi:hypothetical protein